MQRIAKVICFAATFYCGLGYATGLRVPLDNGLGTPGAAAGPALAEDASTAFTNPAGLVRIDHPELVVAINPAFTSTTFEGTVTVDPASPVPVDPIVQSGDAKSTLNVPLFSIHFSYPITDKFYYGLSLINPFGQSVHYEDSAIVNSTVTEGMLITWDVSNSIGYQVTDQFSIGAGIDAILLDFSADNIYPIPTPSMSPIPITLPSIFTRNLASGWNMGWHAGFLYQFNDYKSRIGFNYRAPMTLKAEGRSYSTITNNPGGTPSIGGPTENDDFSISFDLPPIYSLAFYHMIIPHLTLAGSVEYTQWDYFDVIKFENVVNVPGGDFDVQEQYKNTWGYGLALFYQWTQKFRTSIGTKFDYSPINPKYVNVDFPDSDLWVAGISGAYQFNKVVRLELGYSHSFFQEVDIDHYDPVSYVRNQGVGHLYGDIINAQLTINLAPVVRAFDDFNEG